MMRVLLAVGLLASATLACSSTPQPVPLSGPPGDVQALEGEWMGEYHSYEEASRSGTVYFRLQAGQDTAQGDVLMHIAGRETIGSVPHRVQWDQVPEDRVLTVTFVRAAGGTVFGRLDPYHDPVCGCQMKTTFTGRVKGNLIEGTYASEHINGGDRHEGRWRVLRSLTP